MPSPSDHTHATSRIWRPYTQEKTAVPARSIRSAEGAFLTASDGQKIFDGISSWWTITHGHCHPAIVQAIRSQSEKLDQVIFANFTHEPAEEVAELALRATDGRFAKAFFSDNGSTAVEVALKIALQSAVQKGEPRRRKFLALESGYHGDTVGAMSVSGPSVFVRPYREMIFEVIRAAHPNRSSASVSEWTADFLLKLEGFGDQIAAVIVEPLVQGAGGMIVWPDEALRTMASACRAKGVLLIFDEVMTGFGRTGSLFAMDRAEVTPDLICLSKGLTGGALPLGLTLATQEVFDSFLSDEPGRMLFHGHSFTGNPISCAAAAANLKLFANGEPLSRARAVHDAHLECVEPAAKRLQAVDWRICGTIAAIELDPERAGEYGSSLGRRIVEFALANGVFVRPMANIVYLMPTYSSSPADVRMAWQAMVDATERALG